MSQVINVNKISGNHYLGGSISSLLTRFGPLSENIIRVYTKQILQGLHYLHDHNIIHRLIKNFIIF